MSEFRTLTVGGGQHISIPVEGVSYDDCYAKAADQMRSVTGTTAQHGWEFSVAGQWYLNGAELTLENRVTLRGAMTFTLRPYEMEES